MNIIPIQARNNTTMARVEHHLAFFDKLSRPIVGAPQEAMISNIAYRRDAPAIALALILTIASQQHLLVEHKGFAVEDRSKPPIAWLTDPSRAALEALIANPLAWINPGSIPVRLGRHPEVPNLAYLDLSQAARCRHTIAGVPSLLQLDPNLTFDRRRNRGAWPAELERRQRPERHPALAC